MRARLRPALGSRVLPDAGMEASLTWKRMSIRSRTDGGHSERANDYSDTRNRLVAATAQAEAITNSYTVACGRGYAASIGRSAGTANDDRWAFCIVSYAPIKSQSCFAQQSISINLDPDASYQSDAHCLEYSLRGSDCIGY